MRRPRSARHSQMRMIAPIAATTSCASHPSGGTRFMRRSTKFRNSAPTMPSRMLAMMPIRALVMRSAIQPAMPPIMIDPMIPTPSMLRPSLEDDAGDDDHHDRADNREDHLFKEPVAGLQIDPELLGEEAADQRSDQPG